MDRAAALAREAEAWSAFTTQVARLTPEQRRQEGAVPGWSTDDLVWHCAKWGEFAADRLTELGDGPFVDPFGAESDEHWDGLNDRLAAESKTMTTEEIDAGAAEIRRRVREVWSGLPEVGEAAESWFGEETFEHYDEHTDEVRRFADGRSSA